MGDNLLWLLLNQDDEYPCICSCPQCEECLHDNYNFKCGDKK